MSIIIDNVLARTRYLDQVNQFIDKPIIKVLTGMRRVGKSTLLGQIRESLLERGVPEDRIVLINKDILAWDHVRSHRDLDSEVGKALRGVSGARYILIDEIQEIEQWERAITSFLAEGLGFSTVRGNAGDTPAGLGGRAGLSLP